MKKNFKELLNIDYQTHRYKLCEVFLKKQSGITLDQFKLQSKQALKESKLHVFPFQQKLLSYLQNKNMKIIVVTASIQWLVELAVKTYKLPVDQVLGMKTKLEDQVITEHIIRPAPSGSHKAKVLLQHFQKESCFLAGGNTPADQPLLELAKLPFVVNSANSKNIIFSSEQKLKQLALKKNWLLFEKTHQNS